MRASKKPRTHAGRKAQRQIQVAKLVAYAGVNEVGSSLMTTRLLGRYQNRQPLLLISSPDALSLSQREVNQSSGLLLGFGRLVFQQAQEANMAAMDRVSLLFVGLLQLSAY